jgi:hypothetical protein
MKRFAVLILFIFSIISLLTAQEIENAVQVAINSLASGFKAPLQVSITPITMSGTKAPSELSRLLKDLINNSAKNNGVFKVVPSVPGSSAMQTGFIGGSFTPKADVIDVSLFVSEMGQIRSSTSFSFSTEDLLWRYRISIEPANQTELLERQRLFSGLSLPVEKPVRIQAWFNSDSMTYLHCEPLDITVMSDRDCYFKVVLIDVNNYEQMIFPSKNDEDNFLRANTPSTIFKDSSYMFYGPYGAETILVIASANQFDNIRQDYFASPRPATVSSIKNTIGGNSAARYDITILEPHEKHIFPLPSNMSVEVQELETDIKYQGGIFKGDIASGYFILKGIRGSYRAIPQSNPNSIEYVIYKGDVWNGTVSKADRLFPIQESPIPSRSNNGVIFSFSLEKPKNIDQAFAIVKIGIEASNGGKFEGDTNSGMFRTITALGPLAARYYVTNMINIDITERPFAASDNRIITEVKKKFQGL